MTLKKSQLFLGALRNNWLFLNKICIGTFLPVA
jgi:hypothetical protein